MPPIDSRDVVEACGGGNAERNKSFRFVGSGQVSGRVTNSGFGVDDPGLARLRTNAKTAIAAPMPTSHVTMFCCEFESGVEVFTHWATPGAFCRVPGGQLMSCAIRGAVTRSAPSASARRRWQAPALAPSVVRASRGHAGAIPGFMRCSPRQSGWPPSPDRRRGHDVSDAARKDRPRTAGWR